MNALINLPDAFPHANAGRAPEPAPSPAPTLEVVEQVGTAALALSFVSGIVYMLASALQSAPVA